MRTTIHNYNNEEIMKLTCKTLRSDGSHHERFKCFRCPLAFHSLNYSERYVI